MSEQTEMHAPNIHPNPEYYIEREDEIKRIENFIERTDGAVIGLTGVRGAGKSSVMKKIVKYAKGKGYFTLTISSPTGYEEEAFFRMVFMRLCEEVNKKIEKETFMIRTSLEKIAKRGKNIYRTYIVSTIVFLFILLFSIGYLAEQVQSGDPSVSQWGTILYSLVIIVYIIALPLLFLVKRYFQEWKRAKKFPKKVGLYIKTQDILETLKYEKTTSYQAEANVGVISQIVGVFKIGKELTTRPFTLPGLTSEYNDYISEVIKVFKGKAIICIDELDKITDPEQVKKLLRGVKGVLSEDNCYYLISISEDAVKSFKTRFSAERDMLESTFDEIIDLARIDLKTAREIAKKWIGYKDEEELSREVIKSIDMICVLSGGIPRELIRNLGEGIYECGME